MHHEYQKPETLWNPSYFVILVMSILMAIGLHMVTPILSKYVNSIGASMATVGALASLMSVVSVFMRPISGFLADRLSKKALNIAATALAGISVSLYAMTKSIPYISDFVSVPMIPYSLFAGVFSICMSINSSFLVLVGGSRGISNIGVFFTANACALLFVRVVVGRVMDRIGFKRILIPGYLLTGTAMCIMAFATNSWMLVVVGILIAFSQGTAQPMVQAECVRRMPDKRGLAMSICYVGSDLCNAFGANIGGRVADHFGFTPMYLMCAGVMLVSMILFIIFEKRVQAEN